MRKGRVWFFRCRRSRSTPARREIGPYLVLGASGQDGFYASRHFLKRGNHVVGLSRTGLLGGNPRLALLSSYSNYRHIAVSAYTNAFLGRVMREIEPARIVYCAGFRDIPRTPSEVAACRFTNETLLEGVLGAVTAQRRPARVIYPSSAEIFKRAGLTPLRENSDLGPANEYGKAKVAGMQIVEHYRSTQGIFACSAICFNHDSMLSPAHHLARVVPRKLVSLKRRQAQRVSFYDVATLRDWSHAKDFIRAFDLMLEQAAPHDFVVASGQARTLEDYIELVSDVLGLSCSNEVDFVKRPDLESYHRVADSTLIQRSLGWEPRVDLRRLAREMVYLETRIPQICSKPMCSMNLN